MLHCIAVFLLNSWRVLGRSDFNNLFAIYCFQPDETEFLPCTVLTKNGPILTAATMKSSWQSMASQAMLVFLLLCILALMGDSARQSARRRKNFVNARSTLECHRREYTFKAVNREESSGTMCSDYITVESCWGRCNSGEVIKRIKFQCAPRIPLKCNFFS